jgi:hypothetical protein
MSTWDTRADSEPDRKDCGVAGTQPGGERAANTTNPKIKKR